MNISTTTSLDPSIIAAIITVFGPILTGAIAIWSIIVTKNNARKQLEQSKNQTVDTISSTERIARDNIESTFKINNDNLKSSIERRYTDTVAVQRIEWVNRIREEFVDYNSKCDYIIQKLTLEFYKESTEEPDFEDYVPSTLSLLRYINRVYLLSNPREIWFAKLVEEMKGLREFLMDTADPNTERIDYNEYNNRMDRIHFLQQCILKAEWSRTQEEVNTGDKVSGERMKEIIVEIAKEIDETQYSITLKNIV
jgi:hypothetical protein